VTSPQFTKQKRQIASIPPQTTDLPQQTTKLLPFPKTICFQLKKLSRQLKVMARRRKVSAIKQKDSGPAHDGFGTTQSDSQPAQNGLPTVTKCFPSKSNWVAIFNDQNQPVCLEIGRSVLLLVKERTEIERNSSLRGKSFAAYVTNVRAPMAATVAHFTTLNSQVRH
jgi:hypothetical protein